MPKDTKIIKDKNNDADHIIDYQNTNDGKQEKDQKTIHMTKQYHIVNHYIDFWANSFNYQEETSRQGFGYLLLSIHSY